MLYRWVFKRLGKVKISCFQIKMFFFHAQVRNWHIKGWANVCNNLHYNQILFTWSSSAAPQPSSALSAIPSFSSLLAAVSVTLVKSVLQ